MLVKVKKKTDTRSNIYINILWMTVRVTQNPSQIGLKSQRLIEIGPDHHFPRVINYIRVDSFNQKVSHRKWHNHLPVVKRYIIFLFFTSCQAAVHKFASSSSAGNMALFFYNRKLIRIAKWQ